MAAGTVAETDRVTVWLLPAATVNGDAGDVVTPAGNPERVTVTEPEKPFWPVIDTAKLELELPAVAVRVAGERERLKSGRGVTVNDRGAECVSAPDVPLTVSAKVPAGTVAGTVSVTT